jgi:peptide/nickel transport system substrate-binding protein
MFRSRLSWILGALIVVATSAWPADGPAQSPTPRKGGVLRVGMIGEPPTLDAHATTAVITREIGINVFEGLYALDGKYQPVPLLAEGHDVLDGGKRYAIRLRRDVKFHNGKALTSADVVASLKRWGAMASTGKAIFKTVEAVEARGPQAIEIRLKEPAGALLTVLAQVDNAAVIYPKDVLDAAGRSGSSSTSRIVTSSSRASTATRRGPSPPPAWPAGARPTWTRSSSCRCRTTRPARRAC